MAIDRSKAINFIIKSKGLTGEQAEEQKKKLRQLSDYELSAEYYSLSHALSGSQNVQTDFGTDALAGELSGFGYPQNPDSTSNDIPAMLAGIQNQGLTTNWVETSFPAGLGCGFFSAPLNAPNNGGGSGSQANNKAELIANEIFDLQKKGISINDASFLAILHQKINENNVVEVMAAYKAKSKGKSLIELIVGRVNDGTAEQRKESGETLFNYLCQRAFSAGMKQPDINYFSREFDKELKKQSCNTSLGVKEALNAGINKLDNMMNALIFSMKNLNKTSKLLPQNTTNALENDGNSAQETLRDQDKNDGWSENFANYARGVLDYDNTKGDVQTDLFAYKLNMQQLRSAKDSGPDTYADVFRRIFGISYKPANVEAYLNLKSQYQLAMLCDWIETNYKKSVKELLKPPPLPLTEGGKKAVYDKDFSNFAKFLGQGNETEGGKQLLKKLKEKNKNFYNLKWGDKYNILHDLAVEYGNNLKENTNAVTKGKSVDQIHQEYDAAYGAAFGFNNDIVKRVDDYIVAQQTGSMIVKTSAKLGGTILAGALTGGVGLAVFQTLLATGTAAAIVDAGVELSDNPNADVGKVLLSAGINGATVMAGGFGNMVIGIAGKMYEFSPLLEGAAKMAGDILVGMGSELAQSGTVTIGSTVYAGFLSATGHLVSLKKIGQIKEGITKGPEIDSARKTLGIAANAKLTPEIIQKAMVEKINSIKPDGDGKIKITDELKVAKAQLEAAAKVGTEVGTKAGTEAAAGDGISKTKSEAAATKEEDGQTGKTQPKPNPSVKSNFENIVDGLLNDPIDPTVKEALKHYDKATLKAKLMEFCVDDEQLGDVAIKKFANEFGLEISPECKSNIKEKMAKFDFSNWRLTEDGRESFTNKLEEIKKELKDKAKKGDFNPDANKSFMGLSKCQDIKEFCEYYLNFDELSPQGKEISTIVLELKYAQQDSEIGSQDKGDIGAWRTGKNFQNSPFFKLLEKVFQKKNMTDNVQPITIDESTPVDISTIRAENLLKNLKISKLLSEMDLPELLSQENSSRFLSIAEIIKAMEKELSLPRVKIMKNVLNLQVENGEIKGNCIDVKDNSHPLCPTFSFFKDKVGFLYLEKITLGDKDTPQITFKFNYFGDELEQCDIRDKNITSFVFDSEGKVRSIIKYDYNMKRMATYTADNNKVIE